MAMCIEHVCVYTHLCLQTCMCVYTFMPTNMHVRIRIYAYKHLGTGAYRHDPDSAGTRFRFHVHVCIYTYVVANTSTCRCAHAGAAASRRVHLQTSVFTTLHECRCAGLQHKRQTCTQIGTVSMGRFAKLTTWQLVRLPFALTFIRPAALTDAMI